MISVLLYILLYAACFLFGLVTVWYLTNKLDTAAYNDASSVNQNSNGELSDACKVCGKHNCDRASAASISNGNGDPPYANTNFLVEEPISEAFHNFFEVIIDRYVSSWHNEITNREDFVNEIRLQIKFAVSALMHRISKCDIGEFIQNHVIPCSVAHYHLCYAVIAKGNLGSTANLESLILRQLKPHLHVGMKDRNAEYEYVKAIVHKVLPLLLHPTAKSSKSLLILVEEILTSSVLLPAMDTIATPTIINKLLIEALDTSCPPQAAGPQAAMVPVLHQYTELSMAQFKSRPPLQCEWSIASITHVYDNHVLRQAFIDFMKFCDSLDLIIFFGDLEMINRDLLSPDINQNTKHRIYKDIERIHDSLLHNNRLIVQALQLGDEFMTCLRNVVKDGPSSVPQLQTNPAWFNAHECVCSFLEMHYLPEFVASDFYLKATVLEESSNAVDNSTGRSTPRSQGRTASPSLQSPELQQQQQKQQQQQELLSVGVDDDEEALGSSPTLSGKDVTDFSKRLRSQPPSASASSSSLTSLTSLADMSNWRVSVTGLGDNCSEVGSLSSGVLKFVISVGSSDSQETWKIYRKYSEFYVLEEKLREFHGQALGELPLQSKRLIGNSNREFLHAKRPELESFLRCLLAKPLLRQSQLLRLFLTDQLQEFESSLMPDLSFNRFTSKFQRRGLALAKDFLPNLIASTQSSQTQQQQHQQQQDVHTKQESLKQSRLHNYLFWNNAALSSEDSPNQSISCTARSPLVIGAYDTVQYVLHCVLKEESPNPIRKWLGHLLTGMRPLLRPIVDGLFRRIIDYKLSAIVLHHRAVPIIHLLRDLIFFPELHPSTDSDKHAIRAAALSDLINSRPCMYAGQLLGKDCVEAGVGEVYSLLQYPRLNKQLLLTMLDPLLLQLFPELNS